MPTNDNNLPPLGGSAPLPDAHGLAALVLVESLIHGLCEKGTLSTTEAIEVTERAITVQAEQAEVGDGASARMWHSHALLSAIADSLSIDRDAGRDPPR